MKDVVSPEATFFGLEGLMEPFAPAVGVTEKDICEKVAMTLQLAVITSVVYVAPDNDPPQLPPTASIS